MRAEPGLSVADRLFAVIESCAQSPRGLSLVDLAERTGLPKTTLHRSCWKLVELGMLEHGPDGFRVGTKMFALGCMNPELRRLRVLAMPYMHELVAATGRVVNLAVLSDRRALLVDEVFGTVAPAMPKMMGAGMPLHATAIGKALLLGRPAEEIDAAIGTTMLRPYTKHTIVRPDQFREHLRTAAAAGVVFSRNEWRLGTSGLGVPILRDGTVAAALALIGPFDERELRALVAPLRQVALHFEEGISRRLVAA
ncbi:MAG: IclR family transcriptional regulator [Actinobacteria bacterium]|nr:IclR family transcriptional regulator [Actinomycetota bacterium]